MSSDNRGKLPLFKREGDVHHTVNSDCIDFLESQEDYTSPVFNDFLERQVLLQKTSLPCGEGR